MVREGLGHSGNGGQGSRAWRSHALDGQEGLALASSAAYVCMRMSVGSKLALCFPKLGKCGGAHGGLYDDEQGGVGRSP